MMSKFGGLNTIKSGGSSVKVPEKSKQGDAKKTLTLLPRIKRRIKI